MEIMSENDIKNNNKKVDVHATTSERGGLAGFFETLLRKFRLVSYIIALIPLYLISILAMAISLTPAVYFYMYITKMAIALPEPLYYLTISICITLGYFIYGFTLIFVAPAFNFLLPFRLKAVFLLQFFHLIS